ncbi:hypothetical protein GCM10010168_81870 [Actinoplanes ianthinogenes]|uniref:PPM-type phosphatase domain-containing protein n=1 Tax=Actinoplanes ianthinogenes TaxID=122358 RepID=A0ABM7LML4_9ACTN|nr:protein phosphatase 2C domain-containing protein [Actinoplanes ianthinogenes]BCJ40479.1 hypothetical protein Aiant_11360 [Actinoplanes ianthinogenes]GGR50596.1 hypothetical protein GCM10010168_81870 [Actinoplanes ianthinogenes]
MIGAEVAWRLGDRVVTGAGGSVVGQRYDRNYDVWHLDPQRPLAIVADGMGAGEGSAAAGRIAVETFATGITGPDPAALRAAVQEAHFRVREKARTLRELTGCTLTALAGVTDTSAGDAPAAGAAATGGGAAVAGDASAVGAAAIGGGAAVAGDASAVGAAATGGGAAAAGASAGAAVQIVQVGDSRAYRLRGGLLELLTVDHTVAWLGLIHGWYAATDPRAEADGYRLTRYMGHPEQPDPDVLDVPLHPGDRLLLCTDGVAGQVPYQDLSRLLAAGPPAVAVRSLLDATLRAGGQDNATAIVLAVT